MHTQSQPPHLSYREPREDVTPRRLLRRAHLASGVCQECTRAPLAWDVEPNGEPFQRVLCGTCRDRQNAARRDRHASRKRAELPTT